MTFLAHPCSFHWFIESPPQQMRTISVSECYYNNHVIVIRNVLYTTVLEFNSAVHPIHGDTARVRVCKTCNTRSTTLNSLMMSCVSPLKIHLAIAVRPGSVKYGGSADL